MPFSQDLAVFLIFVSAKGKVLYDPGLIQETADEIAYLCCIRRNEVALIYNRADFFDFSRENW